MSVYSIADLHLSGSVEKPMDIFGYRWKGHTEKIRKRWSDIVSSEDTVIVPGDTVEELAISEIRTEAARETV